MSSPGDSIPPEAISPMGLMQFKVFLVEGDRGVRQVMLRVSESDGTLHHFPLDVVSARQLTDWLLEASDEADSADV